MLTCFDKDDGNTGCLGLPKCTGETPRVDGSEHGRAEFVARNQRLDNADLILDRRRACWKQSAQFPRPVPSPQPAASTILIWKTSLMSVLGKIAIFLSALKRW